MKFLVVFALFAFVAVQLSQSAPAPDDEKKDEAAPSEVAIEASSQAAPVEKSAQPEAVASPAEPAAEPHAEEKKS